MDLWHLLYLPYGGVALIWIWGLTSYEACLNTSEIVTQGAFTGSSFWTGRKIGILDCAVACVRRSLCMGFNYDSTDGRLCELFGTLPNRYRRVKRSEFKLHSYITNWTSEIDSTCFSRPCSANAVCVPLAQPGLPGENCSFTCFNFTSLCPKPTKDFSGPRTVGATFQCAESGLNTTCQDNLKWSESCAP